MNWCLTIVMLYIVLTSNAQLKHGARDEHGRHVIPRGFVNNTNDAVGELYYTPEDYLRMVRMGANYQVVRLELGKLSEFGGKELDDNYLLKLDTLVNLGTQSGIKTVFKMTVYGADNFEWESFWEDQNSEQNDYISAWEVIWKRYKEEASVAGYDLVNEPRKHSMDISYSDLTEKYLVPVFQKIIDAYYELDSGKNLYCQGIFMNKGDKVDNNQYAEITKSIERENVVFTPHIYSINKIRNLSSLQCFGLTKKQTFRVVQCWLGNGDFLLC
ncbi:MAG: cellulase family glycosylhydrolase [Cyclobacteriaceae bacterium]